MAISAHPVDGERASGGTVRQTVATIMAVGLAAAAHAGEPVRVAAPTHQQVPPSEARIGPIAPGPDTRIRLDDPEGRLHRGIGGTLVEMRPFATSRFHLAAGERLFGRPRANRAFDERGLLAVPRGGGNRVGGRRFAPALLMGVDERLATGLSLGLDAGVVMGPAMDRGLRGTRGMAGRGRSGAAGANGIARVTMGLRF